MPAAETPPSPHELSDGDRVELIEADPRQGLRKGARGTVVATLRYWDRIRVDFGRGRQVAVAREKLRRVP